MVVFLLRDNYPEPNCEEYDYLVKMDITGTDYSKEEILEEIRKFIEGIPQYDVPVTEYLTSFLNNRNIKFKITRFCDADTIYY